jgi:hypothetical protein
LASNYPQLTGIQSRILIIIFQSGSDLVNNEIILKGADISRSTWAVEQNRLIEFGLLEKRSARTISRKNVFKTVNYRLTARGKAIAFNLLEISKILGSAERPAFPASISKMSSQEDSEFDSRVLEIIEIALEGYGINFVGDVRAAIESEHRIQWKEVTSRADLLEEVLVEFFGSAGAHNVVSMICANIRSRFGLDKREPDDLQHLLNEAREAFRGLHREPISEENGASIAAEKKFPSGSIR